MNDLINKARKSLEHECLLQEWISVTHRHAVSSKWALCSSEIEPIPYEHPLFSYRPMRGFPFGRHVSIEIEHGHFDSAFQLMKSGEHAPCEMSDLVLAVDHERLDLASLIVSDPTSADHADMVLVAILFGIKHTRYGNSDRLRKLQNEGVDISFSVMGNNPSSASGFDKPLGSWGDKQEDTDLVIQNAGDSEARALMDKLLSNHIYLSPIQINNICLLASNPNNVRSEVLLDFVLNSISACLERKQKLFKETVRFVIETWPHITKNVTGEQIAQLELDPVTALLMAPAPADIGLHSPDLVHSAGVSGTRNGFAKAILDQFITDDGALLLFLQAVCVQGIKYHWLFERMALHMIEHDYRVKAPAYESYTFARHVSAIRHMFWLFSKFEPTVPITKSAMDEFKSQLIFIKDLDLLHSPYKATCQQWLECEPRIQGELIDTPATWPDPAHVISVQDTQAYLKTNPFFDEFVAVGPAVSTETYSKTHENYDMLLSDQACDYDAWDLVLRADGPSLGRNVSERNVKRYAQTFGALDKQLPATSRLRSRLNELFQISKVVRVHSSPSNPILPGILSAPTVKPRKPPSGLGQGLVSFMREQRPEFYLKNKDKLKALAIANSFTSLADTLDTWQESQLAAEVDSPLKGYTPPPELIIYILSDYVFTKKEVKRCDNSIWFQRNAPDVAHAPGTLATEAGKRKLREGESAPKTVKRVKEQEEEQKPISQLAKIRLSYETTIQTRDPASFNHITTYDNAGRRTRAPLKSWGDIGMAENTGYLGNVLVFIAPFYENRVYGLNKPQDMNEAEQLLLPREGNNWSFLWTKDDLESRIPFVLVDPLRSSIASATIERIKSIQSNSLLKDYEQNAWEDLQYNTNRHRWLLFTVGRARIALLLIRMRVSHPDMREITDLSTDFKSESLFSIEPYISRALQHTDDSVAYSMLPISVGAQPTDVIIHIFNEKGAIMFAFGSIGLFVDRTITLWMHCNKHVTVVASKGSGPADNLFDVFRAIMIADITSLRKWTVDQFIALETLLFSAEAKLFIDAIK